MRGRLRPVLALGWVLLVAGFAAGVIFYVLAERSASEQDHRAQVVGTLLAAGLLVQPALVWARSHQRTPVSATTPGQTVAAADLLAIRMSVTWSRQAEEEQGIWLSAPVQVRWEWADAQLAVARDEVNAPAESQTDPLPIPGVGVGNVLSSGLVTRLHDRVYARLRHGRLVLIGGPGAGKTAAMMMLLLAALRRRKQVSEADRAMVPVPVWLTLGSWDPHAQGLREWVTKTMARDHPYLGASEFGPDATGALFDTGQIALFLDGLDEMPDARRGEAIRRLQAEAAGLRVVLTSRPDEYQATLNGGGQLSTAAVIELQPVGPQAAVDYLLASRAEQARHAWIQVTDRLRAEPDGVLARTLNTPLALSLARTAYPTDPAPLLDPALATEKALRQHLLDQVLVTAYPKPRERERATYWLSWIAHHMNTGSADAIRDLRWWDIPIWTAGGLPSRPRGSRGERTVEPRRLDVRPPGRRELWVLFMGRRWWSGPLSVALLAVLVGRQGGDPRMFLILFASLFAIKVMTGEFRSVAGLLGLWSQPLATTQVSSPIEVYRADRWRTVVVEFLYGIGAGLVGGIGFGAAGGIGFGALGGLIFAIGAGFGPGIQVGKGPALGLGVGEAVWALKGRRVRFMWLLQTALDRRVLRQAGAVYQFRHADLQDRLADRYRRDHLHPDGRITRRTTGVTTVDLLAGASPRARSANQPPAPQQQSGTPPVTRSSTLTTPSLIPDPRYFD